MRMYVLTNPKSQKRFLGGGMSGINFSISSRLSSTARHSSSTAFFHAGWLSDLQQSHVARPELSRIIVVVVGIDIDSLQPRMQKTKMITVPTQAGHTCQVNLDVGLVVEHF